MNKHSGRETEAVRSTRVVAIVAAIYRRVLREDMGSEARNFIKDLSLVTIGSGIAAMLTFVFGVLGGRVLGPEQYGEFALVQSASDFLQIPMMLGFSAATVRYLSQTQDRKRQSTVATTSYVLVALFTVTSCSLFVLFRTQLAPLLSVPTRLHLFAVGLATAHVFYAIVASTQRGIGRIRAFAAIQPVYGAILLATFLLFAAGGARSFETMAYPQALAYVSAGAITLFSLRSHHSTWGFDKPMAALLFRYAFFALVAGTFSAIYTNVGKILISRYMTLSDVGIFSAYYSPSLNVATLLFLTFNSVFFPAASRYQDKESLFRKIDRLVPHMIILGTPLVFAFEFIILKLYGNRYPVNPALMLVFAFSAVLVMWYGVNSSTFASEGIRGVKMTNISVGTIAVLDVMLSLVLIPWLGLVGATAAIGTSFGGGIICLRLLRRRLLKIRDRPTLNLGPL